MHQKNVTKNDLLHYTNNNTRKQMNSTAAKIRKLILNRIYFMVTTTTKVSFLIRPPENK
jgi:hypothetical protein